MVGVLCFIVSYCAVIYAIIVEYKQDEDTKKRRMTVNGRVLIVLSYVAALLGVWERVDAIRSHDAEVARLQSFIDETQTTLRSIREQSNQLVAVERLSTHAIVDEIAVIQRHLEENDDLATAKAELVALNGSIAKEQQLIAQKRDAFLASIHQADSTNLKGISRVGLMGNLPDTVTVIVKRGDTDLASYKLMRTAPVNLLGVKYGTGTDWSVLYAGNDCELRVDVEADVGDHLNKTVTLTAPAASLAFDTFSSSAPWELVGHYNHDRFAQEKNGLSIVVR